jgi:hypothetical protein
LKATRQGAGLLDWLAESRYGQSMIIFFDIKDRIRLRERFYGASQSVLARL